jgi:hypothetical protein
VISRRRQRLSRNRLPASLRRLRLDPTPTPSCAVRKRLRLRAGLRLAPLRLLRPVVEVV